ncbi:ribosome biogenesis GTPase Der [Candidatus Methylacidiphilum infernorum]|uniref:GTPase Der n=1 Tax=Candidatus Methylacidiphilum infernorum TaxID=511746 RepID=A0ABX7PT39_9BACT|nr:ribosome biogenesis GTPase Der [Candidatus Methylacidiphilum infernorum]QSR86130.1 ribosome biogenesis GTPase Der [Candidatus Methylacidiphilum infernorum]
MKTIAIVGRPNVGKSLLFNRLCGKEISLVYDQPGVTRDRIVCCIKKEGKEIVLVDTGGLVFDCQTDLEKSLFDQISVAVEEAHHILFVVDGRSGLLPLDKQIAKFLREKHKAVTVVVNKLDHPGMEHFCAEFANLGFEEIFAVSAAHNLGINQLLEKIFSLGAEERENPIFAPSTRIAVIGQPNAGKSTLINSLIGESRLVVHEEPGTTHDAVEVGIEVCGVPFTFIDTAGLKKKNKLKEGLEIKVSGRTVHSINRSHLVWFIIDSQKGITLQDKKIGGLIQKAFKPCMVILNKIDLLEDQLNLKEGNKKGMLYVQEQLPFLSYAPVVVVSAEKKWNFKPLLSTLLRVDQERKKRIPTHRLTQFFQETLNQYPPPQVQGKRLKIYYATQIYDKEGSGGSPCPTFILFVNNPNYIKETYQKFLEKQFRQAFCFRGCPLLWKWRKAEGKGESSLHQDVILSR